MHPPSRSPFDRLRASKLLPALLLWLLTLTAAGAGFHLASHVAEAAGPQTGLGSTTENDLGDTDAASLDLDCAACRVAAAASLALAPTLEGQLDWLLPPGQMAPSHHDAETAIDAVVRWQQTLKDGPPSFSR